MKYRSTFLSKENAFVSKALLMKAHFSPTTPFPATTTASGALHNDGTHFPMGTVNRWRTSDALQRESAHQVMPGLQVNT